MNHRTDMAVEEGFDMTSSGEMSPGRGYPPQQRFEASFARRRYFEDEVEESSNQGMPVPPMAAGMHGLQVYRREQDPHVQQSFHSYGREGETRKSISPMPDYTNPISPYNLYGGAMQPPQAFNRLDLDTDRPSMHGRGPGSVLSWQWDQRAASPQHVGNNHARQLQSLLQHTAHYIQEFDRPPRLLRCSFKGSSALTDLVLKLHGLHSLPPLHLPSTVVSLVRCVPIVRLPGLSSC